MDQDPLICCECCFCHKWLIEEVLEEVFIPDQTGHVKKLACWQCIREIKERSCK